MEKLRTLQNNQTILENDKTIKEIPLKQAVEIPTPLQGDLYEFLIKRLKAFY